MSSEWTYYRDDEKKVIICTKEHLGGYPEVSQLEAYILREQGYGAVRLVIPPRMN